MGYGQTKWWIITTKLTKYGTQHSTIWGNRKQPDWIQQQAGWCIQRAHNDDGGYNPWIQPANTWTHPQSGGHPAMVGTH